MIFRTAPSSRTWRGLAVGILLLVAMVLGHAAHAAVNPEIANCEELKDPVTLDQAELCSAHIGCRFVLGVQRVCTRVKQFLDGVSTAADAMGQGFRRLFSSNQAEPQRAADALFTARLTPSTRRNDTLAELETARKSLQWGLGRPTANETLTGPAETGSGEPAWVYYGEVSAGKPQGWGTSIGRNGVIWRTYRGGAPGSAADILLPDGTRRTGDFDGPRMLRGTISAPDGRLWFARQFDDQGQIQDGWFEQADGVRFEGTFSAGKRSYGKLFRPDGSLAEEGQYDAREMLSQGRRFGPDGKTVVAAVDAQADRRRAQENAEAQRQQAFRQQLDNANPGELFALQDQLSAAGDTEGARQALRALVRRFPDHPMAEIAARQLSSIGMPSAAGAAGSNAAARGSRPAGGSASGGTCKEAYAAKDRELAARPVPGGGPVPAYRYAMWLMDQLMDTVRARCSGAEREALLKELQRAYSETEEACSAMATQRCTSAGG